MAKFIMMTNSYNVQQNIESNNKSRITTASVLSRSNDAQIRLISPLDI